MLFSNKIREISVPLFLKNKDKYKMNVNAIFSIKNLFWYKC